MIQLSEYEPRFSVVSEAVTDRASHCSYELRAAQICDLVEQENYADAVKVLTDSFRTGGYAAAVVWTVAVMMYKRETMDYRFLKFNNQIDQTIRDLRIVPRGKCGRVNALAYINGVTQDAHAAAKGTMYQVIHKPLLAAARAAFVVSFSGTLDNETKISRFENLIENVVMI